MGAPSPAWGVQYTMCLPTEDGARDAAAEMAGLGHRLTAVRAHDHFRSDPSSRPSASTRERGDRLAAVVAGSLAQNHVLCDLLSAQGGVLEHNISVAVAARYKRATLDNIVTLAELVRRHVPEVGDDAFILCGGIFVVAGAMWPHSRPSANMLAAIEADPALAVLRTDFTGALEFALATFVAGTIARAATGEEAG